MSNQRIPYSDLGEEEVIKRMKKLLDDKVKDEESMPTTEIENLLAKRVAEKTGGRHINITVTKEEEGNTYIRTYRASIVNSIGQLFFFTSRKQVTYEKK